tara:strand:- start:57 stop:332 length:276 start_codon:yes stop_codon:yes gene_type:complete
MAITKTVTTDKVELSELGIIFIRDKTIIKEDGVEISSSFHRHSITPRIKLDGSWGDTDISSEGAWVQSIAAGAWTDSVKTAFETHMDNVSP